MMADQPTLAQSIYPDQPSAANPPAPPAPKPTNEAAQRIYGATSDKPAKLPDGKSPLGGQAVSAEQPQPNAAAKPPVERPPPTQTEPAFDPAKLAMPEGAEPNREVIDEFAKVAG